MKTKLFLASVTISLFGVLLIGCGSPGVYSRRASNCDEGFVYALPVGKIHILATRQNIIYTNSPVITAIFTNAVSLVLSTNAYQSANFPWVSSQTHSSTVIVTNGVTQTTITNFNDSTNYTNSSTPQITSNYLSSQLTVTVSNPPPSTTTNYLYNIAIDVEYYPDPDPKAKIDAKINKNAFYDQNWTLTGNNELLSFVGTTNTDESGNIASQLAQSAASIAVLAFGIPTTTGISVPELSTTNSLPPGYVPPAQIEVLFDPFNPTERAIAEQELSMGGITLSPDDFPFPIKRKVHEVPKERIDGVYYRVLNSYQLELSDPQNNQITRTVLLPDKFSLYHVKIDKWPLDTSSVQASMNNGTLVGYSVQKPSQVEGGVALIPNTISTLISPATQLLNGLFTVKVNSAATQSAVSGYAVSNALYQAELKQIQSSNSAAP